MPMCGIQGLPQQLRGKEFACKAENSIDDLICKGEVETQMLKNKCMDSKGEKGVGGGDWDGTHTHC